MNYLDLNHALIGHKTNVFATALLLVGVGVAITIFLVCQQLSRKTELLQTSLQQPRFPAPRMNRLLLQANAKTDAAKNGEMIAVQAIIKEILLPWPLLFKSLESVDSAEVKLLALEPDAKLQTLHITAVALDSDSMMAYVEALAQQEILQEVVLQSQESTEISGQKAIRFVIGATWKA